MDLMKDEETLNDGLYCMLFILYLIPGSPKDGFTYFAGMLPVKLIPFLVVTFIARIPSVLSSTICGYTLPEQNYWLSAGVFVGTVALALLGGFVYKRILDRAGEENDSKPPDKE